MDSAGSPLLYPIWVLHAYKRGLVSLPLCRNEKIWPGRNTQSGRSILVEPKTFFLIASACAFLYGWRCIPCHRASSLLQSCRQASSSLQRARLSVADSFFAARFLSLCNVYGQILEELKSSSISRFIFLSFIVVLYV
ncbi:hypothetical protein KSP39_PZI017351 [Platanthera zijinensis]|uniref:Uncharacterized protein n=1 Tax=Platanthera zijinensis TaxID=2320716 RepID=A0AAP0B5F1_9ASPA